jgi:two-component system, NarL family, sensor kinase
LEHAEDPATVLAQVAETVAEALQLPYAAIELSAAAGDPAIGATVAGHGRRAGDAEAFPMTYQGAVVGRLLVSPRSASQPFTADERVLVEDLARQAGSPRGRSG